MPWIRFLPILALVLAPVAWGADFAYPDTPAGAAARAFLEALNSGDEAQQREFTLAYRTHEALAKRPIETRLAQYKQMAGMLGRLEPRAVREDAHHQLTVIVYAENPAAFFDLSFDCEPDPPHKVEEIRLVPGREPGSEREWTGWTDLESLLTLAREDGHTPAIAAAVCDENGILEVAAVGTRAMGGETPVTPADRFHIGSVTKSMTATLIARLVADGWLRFDETLGGILGDMPMLEVYRSVTVRQLLDHAAGVREYLQMDEAEMDDLLSLPGTPTEQRRAFAERVLNEEPLFTPGEAMMYTNAGYAVLGYLAESRAGRSWETLLSEWIFEPLGMTGAGTGWPAETDPDQPWGHYALPDGVLRQPLGTYQLPPCLDPAGDVHATPGGLIRYAQAHLRGLLGQDNDLLPATTVIELHPAADAENGSYAGGWVADRGGKGNRDWHNGSAGTFFAYALLDRTHRRAGVVLFNSGDMNNQRVAERILQTWFGGAEE